MPLSVDVAWDLFLFLAVFLFSLNIFKHPKFGKVFSIIGVILSLAFIAINIATFPIPPEESGLFNLGPVVGLFGLAITVNILLKYKWVIEKTDKGGTLVI